MTATRVAVDVAYLLSAVLFILGLKRLGKVRTARNGNAVAALAMGVAVVATFVDLGVVDYRWILGGIAIGSLIGGIAAYRVQMTEMPELVAVFNGFGGAASGLVALSQVYSRAVAPGANQPLSVVLQSAQSNGAASAISSSLSVIIGAVTLTGSVIAYGKLSGRLGGGPVLLPGRHLINGVLFLAILGVGGWVALGVSDSNTLAMGFWVLTGLALLLGILLVLPIGGADMPVVISLLNSYSGVAASATGFVLGNNLLIIGGAMVGASGLILTRIMCVAMNRSLANVVFGGFGTDDGGGAKPSGEYVNVTSCGAEEAAMVLEDARSVVFVPGYGLAVAQAQHAVRELANLLESQGVSVKYAIHPVAGRMPGHMNVLLAEADVPYDQLVEMDAINPELPDTDVAIVIGANDVVNPAALTQKSSPIYGMPIIEVARARTVFVIKRGLGAGFSGVKNELFEGDNTMMVYGDAKKVLQGLTSELKESGYAAAA